MPAICRNQNQEGRVVSISINDRSDSGMMNAIGGPVGTNPFRVADPDSDAGDLMGTGPVHAPDLDSDADDASDGVDQTTLGHCLYNPIDCLDIILPQKSYPVLKHFIGGCMAETWRSIRTSFGCLIRNRWKLFALRDEMICLTH